MFCVLSTVKIKAAITAYKSQYLGCFVDGADRDLNGLHETTSLMTVESCIQYCYSNAYPFAGLEAA
jgi:hypothetical protein